MSEPTLLDPIDTFWLKIAEHQRIMNQCEELRLEFNRKEHNFFWVLFKGFKNVKQRKRLLDAGVVVLDEIGEAEDKVLNLS